MPVSVFLVKDCIHLLIFLSVNILFFRLLRKNVEKSNLYELKRVNENKKKITSHAQEMNNSVFKREKAKKVSLT